MTSQQADTQAPIRIVHVAGSAQWAGGEVFLQLMAEHLDKRAFELRVICPENGPLQAEMQRRGIPCEMIPLGPLGHPGPLWKLRRLLRDWRPSIVQSHGARSNFYAALAAGSIPHVATIHNALTDYPIPRWKKSIYQIFNSLMVSQTNRIICVANSLRDDIVRHHSTAAGKTAVIHNGVDFRRFRSDPHRRAETRKNLELGSAWTLGIIGRLTPQKGHIYLLDALQLARAELDSCQILIIGDGPLRTFLEKRSVALGLRSLCRFLGRREDIPAMLDAVDAIALPSVSEGFPYVVLEAMAMGKPVIASRVNGVEEIISTGDEGFLVPARNAAALADSIRRARTDVPESRARAKKGNKRVHDLFSTERWIDRWQNLYRELASGRTGS